MTAELKKEEFLCKFPTRYELHSDHHVYCYVRYLHGYLEKHGGIQAYDDTISPNLQTYSVYGNGQAVYKTEDDVYVGLKQCGRRDINPKYVDSLDSIVRASRYLILDDARRWLMGALAVHKDNPAAVK